MIINVPENISGIVIEKLGRRKGVMMELKQHRGQVRITFKIPTRGLLGYRNQFLIDTRGLGILSSRFIGFQPFTGEINRRETGSMVSMASGKAAAYSLWNLQERGTLYIEHGTEVYEGMVIGNTARGDEMAVNPIKGKNLTNMRASGSDEAIQLTSPMKLTIEKGMEIMADDEYLEITPQSVRLRKQFLKEVDRVRVFRKTHDK